MCKPFSVAEVCEVVNDLPGNKALGPDGLDAEYYKTFWPSIQEGFLRAVEHFYHTINYLLDGE